jgi:2-polyprenyl-3-methyl-5-hydroxy-6-metoxy-1,4-benzoquinol methylase
MNTATNWDMPYKNSKDFAALSTADLNFLLENIDPRASKTALDIGSGTGQACRDLYHRGYDVTGIDGSEVGIALAKRATIHVGKGIDFMRADIETDDIGSGRYGLVICKYVYAFVHDKDKFLDTVSKHMGDSATFVIISPSVLSVPPEKAHITVDYDETLAKLKAAFTQVNSSERNGDIYYFCK